MFVWFLLLPLRPLLFITIITRITFITIPILASTITIAITITITCRAIDYAGKNKLLVKSVWPTIEPQPRSHTAYLECKGHLVSRLLIETTGAVI